MHMNKSNYCSEPENEERHVGYRPSGAGTYLLADILLACTDSSSRRHTPHGLLPIRNPPRPEDSRPRHSGLLEVAQEWRSGDL